MQIDASTGCCVSDVTTVAGILSHPHTHSPWLSFCPNMSIEKKLDTSNSNDDPSEIDLYSFHEPRDERHAGRLIIDAAEAEIELGVAVAARLKLSEDGTKVL